MDYAILYPVEMPKKGLTDEETTASSTARMLGANLIRLMEAHPEVGSNPKLGKRTDLGTGTISRLRNGEVEPTTKTLEKLARAFHVEPWQLLVPNLEPGNLPTLQPVTETERRLYERLREVAKEFKEAE